MTNDEGRMTSAPDSLTRQSPTTPKGDKPKRRLAGAVGAVGGVGAMGGVKKEKLCQSLGTKAVRNIFNYLNKNTFLKDLLRNGLQFL